MAYFAITDACDANEAFLESGDIRILPPIFQIYGKRRAFSGRIVTVKVFEDNILVREFVASKGHGRVLVIDGGGSMKCALIGGKLSQSARNNGWAGVVVYGCVRDVDDINGCDIGVRALAAHPKKPKKNGNGERHNRIYIAGAEIHDGEWLYADTDGIIVSKTELSL
ncbi:putative 4-hydroxy-4-methyl-2-oxoglutarate aldolase 2 [Primulina huaijiensis]|uniref:putative 4-hydroxy-4-methyl-2-oxoglutarate aldolase 2 n=1 Tax=Primulina huaijiensis TaxID=1492673 RepID=UPI003CC6DE4A